jgi:hypothetical protein
MKHAFPARAAAIATAFSSAFSAAACPQVAVHGTKVEQGSIFPSIVCGQRCSYDESVDSKELPEPLGSGFHNWLIGN